MRASLPFASLVAAALLLSMTPCAFTQNAAPSSAQPPSIKAEAYGKLPLSFEANRGQTDPQVRFLSRGNGYSLFLTDTAAVLSLRQADPPRPKSLLHQPAPQPAAIHKSDVVRMELAGASRGLRVEGADQLPGTANYFIGNDPAKWRSAVPTFAKVRYAGVYPGVDLVYYGNQRQLEYDFVVAPHADPKPIRLHFAGARKLKLDPNGDLEVIAKNGQIAFHKPVIYQQTGGQRHPIEGTFTLLAKNTVAFTLGTYDHEKAVVIDPTLAYSTYLGGSGQGDSGNSITVDLFGFAYVVGSTTSADFPTTVASYEPKGTTATGGAAVSNAFITKMNLNGTGLIYSTYLGGSRYSSSGCFGGIYGGSDTARGVALDGLGNAYVTGCTSAFDFPTTMGAFQPALAESGGFNNAFVTELSADGAHLVYSTYLGGGGDVANAIALDSNNNAYIAGSTGSDKFPTTFGSLQPVRNGTTAFITKLNSTGSGLIYSTFLGGVSSGGVASLAVDQYGVVYVTGSTAAKTFPVTPLAFQLTNNEKTATGTCPFVAKLNSGGSALLYATYLGGTGGDGVNDYAHGIAVDALQNAYVVGQAGSPDFPTTKGSFQPLGPILSTYGTYAFITKLNAAGSGLIYSSYLGGGGDGATAITLDAAGQAYVIGSTSSSKFPTTFDAFQRTLGPSGGSTGNPSFLSQFSADGSQLVYSTLIGGSAHDYAYGVALDLLNNAYIVGKAESTNFPTTPGAFQTTNKSAYNGLDGNAFISKFVLTPPTATKTSISSDGNPQNSGTKVTFTAYVQSNSGTGIPTGNFTFTVDGGTGVSVAIDSTGHASYAPSTLALGNHTIVATYSGDMNYSPSSNSLTESIVLVPSKIVVVSGAGQISKIGTAFAKPLIVQVTNVNGINVPGASVSFSGNGLKFSTVTAVTNASGQASVTITPVLSGTLSALASVSGTPFVVFTETSTTTVSKTPPTFATMAILQTGASAAGASLQAATADLNADGKADLATTNTIDSSVSLLAGNGDGTFKAPVNYATGKGPYGVAAGDFDGDGKPDLAVVNGLDNTVSILLNSAGAFPAKPSFTYAVGSQPYGVSVADLNRDGNFDLVVTNNAAKTLSVLLGKGDGSFQAAVAYAVGSYPFMTAVADVNNDGYPDLIVQNYGDNTVGVLLNTKAGTFLPQATYATGTGPFSVTAGDFNGDGYPDLAVANLGANTVSVLLNNKAGGFASGVSYAAGRLPTFALAADLNGDGVLDLATANLGDGTVSILLGKGDGTFLARTNVNAGTEPYVLQAADFNGDGRPDLAVSNFFSPSFGVLLQTASGTSARMKGLPPGTLTTTLK